MMNQLEAEEKKRLYQIKHQHDAVCANCRYCKNKSAFPQYESYWRCDVDNENINDRYKQSCPAFDKR